ncbi:hypothetical protein ABZ897_15040 [Nonomuraea sp. NPDC046802]|uniref:hypothetical protein n=1 Tax=Nonomuraea sp. NPDC046802 TaxID=3154919 RepID=UPI0033E6B034
MALSGTRARAHTDPGGGSGSHASPGGAGDVPRVFFEDCVVEADTLLVGPYARLEVFTDVIDEDYGGVFPEHLEFADCEDLGEIYINADAACWELTLRGHLPKLYEIKQDATPYGRFTSAVVDASAKDETRYRGLIQRGQGFTKHW